MKKIPEKVAKSSLHDKLTAAGLELIHQGKVRDTYALPDDLLFVDATDRISIFNFVLSSLIPLKGEILTALTVFWLDGVLKNIPNHLVAFGQKMDEYLPSQLRGDKELYRRAIIVKKLTMIPVECIVRGYLTGSAWQSYQKTQHVCGILLPPDLHDGKELSEPIFTPTTKELVGHDQDMDAEEVIRRYGIQTREFPLSVYNQMAKVARQKGLIMADTKLELGFGDGHFILADEVGTPDSSRFWDEQAWVFASKQKRTPEPFDKEFVRNWGKQYELKHRDPTNPDDLEFVRGLTIPSDIIEETRQRYETVLRRLTGLTLAQYQQEKLGVS